MLPSTDLTFKVDDESSIIFTFNNEWQKKSKKIVEVEDFDVGVDVDIVCFFVLAYYAVTVSLQGY